MKVKKQILRTKNWSIAMLLLGLSMASGTALAEELAVDPNDVVAPPTGTTITALYSLNTKSSKLYSDSNMVLNNVDFKTNIGLLRLGHVYDVGGFKILPQLLVPFGRIDLAKDLGAQSAVKHTGFGDPIIGATAWLVANPESKTWFGIPIYLSVPAGDYDGSTGPFNIGENRWKLITQAGVAKGLTDKLLAEVIGEVSFYGKNDDFYGRTMKQESSQSLMGHLTYKATEKTSLSVSYYHTLGGETKVDGIKQDDSKNTNRWLATASTWFAPGWNFQVQYGQDIDVKNGIKEDHRVNLRLAKLF